MEAAREQGSTRRAPPHVAREPERPRDSQAQWLHAAGNMAVQSVLVAGKPTGARSAFSGVRRGTVQKKCACSAGHKPCSKCASESVQPSLSGNGEPLAFSQQVHFERLLGGDFSNVRVHRDEEAAHAAEDIHARAFTVGDRIAFGRGEYQPETEGGQQLLAHELAHVVQQATGARAKCKETADADTAEREADNAANAVVRYEPAQRLSAAPPGVPQRDERKDYSNEDKSEFATRVLERGASRLVENMAVLDKWRDYVNSMEGFQLRAQLMTGTLMEYATVASRTPSGRERFERGVGTHHAADRAFEESMLDIESTYRERVYSMVADLSGNAFGYYTSPSEAERLRVVAGEITEKDLAPSEWVPADPRYAAYRDPIERFRTGKEGGCQFCHDINRAWQETTRVWGAPMPHGDLFGKMHSVVGRLDQLRSAALGSSFMLPVFPSGGSQRSPMVPLSSTSSTTNTTTTNNPPPADTGQQATNDFAPAMPVPEGVTIPPPRTSLCEALPDAPDSARIPNLASWGPASAVVARIVAKMDAVLMPLGPRGYRVLGRQNFDDLYSMSPDNMTSVRAGIASRIDQRKSDYGNLRHEIQAGKVPYEELCPIVDEFLPSTNRWVRYQAIRDVEDWQTREKALTAIELVLTGLTVLFPPAAVVTVPAGVLLGLSRMALGFDQQRQGRQWSEGIGARVYSSSQEAEAPGLAAHGRSNIIFGGINAAFSALGTFGMISRLQQSQQMLRALESGAIITHQQYPGIYLLAKNGRLLMVTETGEVLGYGTISNGRIWFTKLEVPFSASSYGAGVTPSTEVGLVPYGSRALTPYGGSSFGGSTTLAPFGGDPLTGPQLLGPNALALSAQDQALLSRWMGTADAPLGTAGSRPGLPSGSAGAATTTDLVPVGPSAIAGHQLQMNAAGNLVRCSNPACQLLTTTYGTILQRSSHLQRAIAALERRAPMLGKAETARRAAAIEEAILDRGIDMVLQVGKVPESNMAALRQFIKTNPQQLERLEPQLEAMEQVEARDAIDVPTQVGGVDPQVMSRVRKGATTKELRDWVNLKGKYVPGMADPALPGRVVTGRLQPDHLYALKKIFQMAGAGDLSEEEMLSIARWKGNLDALSPSANYSKGSLSYAEWQGHLKSGTMVDPALRRTRALREFEAEEELQILIDWVRENGPLPMNMKERDILVKADAPPNPLKK